MQVKKRDGRVEEFDRNKILESIKQACLAVENDDEEIERSEKIFREARKSYLKAGYSASEATALAENNSIGYLLDGVYTEFDENIANEVIDTVIDTIYSRYEDNDDAVVSVHDIAKAVESALVFHDHNKTAHAYISHREQRDKVRELNSRIMKTYEDITFHSSIESDTKRENANIDGNSAMGTMLKYGSEGAKEFNLTHLVSPEYSNAHRKGDIHIHDLDFMALTATCVSADTLLLIQHEDGTTCLITADEFDKELDGFPVDTVVKLSGLKILSRGEFVGLRNCVRHNSSGKKVLKITTDKTNITLTSEHKVPVVRDGKEILVEASDIIVGDKFYKDCLLERGTYGDFSLENSFTTVVSIEEVEYSGYVYDFETENHYFSANGLTVHNCCQIDLEKLFENGFSTGHGYLREPSEIRSYAALACIAIQSNQNDMHREMV